MRGADLHINLNLCIARMKLLIIDDERELTDALSSRLRNMGYAVDTAYGGLEGVRLASVSRYDLIILDLNLPDMGGEAVCHELRKHSYVPPILMLSVVSDAFSKARLLDAGADDYLAKPFLFDELHARMRALVRRPGNVALDTLVAGDVVIDVISKSVRRGARHLELTAKEFAILEYLMRRVGCVVPKSELVEHIWNSRTNPLSQSAEMHLSNLRRKLGSPELIHTVRGIGYRVG